MWRLAACLVVVVGLLAGSHQALAGGGHHGRDGKGRVVVPGCPELEKLANRENRAFGEWLNFRDWFYFSGDTNSFSEFLADYAAVKQGPLLLTIHAGRPPRREKVSSSYDWAMEWAGVFFHYDDGTRRYSTKVDVWLGRNIRLSDLKVPTSIQVKSGGEIERFIEQHNKLRVEAEKTK